MKVKIAYIKNESNECDLIKNLKINHDIIQLDNFASLVKRKDIDFFVSKFCDYSNNCKKNRSYILVFDIIKPNISNNFLQNVKCFNCSYLSKFDFFYQDTCLKYLNISRTKISSELESVIDIIDKDLFVSSFRLSRKIGINRNKLFAMFKQELNVSFSKYKLWYRVSKTVCLLIRHNMNLIDITFRLEYSSYSQLTRDFKNTINLTPYSFIKKKDNIQIANLFKKWKQK